MCARLTETQRTQAKALGRLSEVINGNGGLGLSQKTNIMWRWGAALLVLSGGALGAFGKQIVVWLAGHL